MERVPIERILCPVDFSEFSVWAYKYAFSLARRYGAKLFVQHVVEQWRHPYADFAATAEDYYQFFQRLSIEAERRLRSFVKNHSSSGYAPEYVIQEGIAADCIIPFAEKESINLIVIGAHGLQGADRFVIGSVTEKVLRRSHCPVLAVHEASSNPIQAITAERGIDLREILFCTDFSDSSKSAIDFALSIAEEYKANLTLMHVLDGIARSRDRENTDKAHRLLKELVPQSLKQDRRIRTTVRIGSAYKEICRLALEKKADLTIMGVHHRNSLERAIFGSTTYRVVQRGSCPVLAVHS